MRYTPKELEDLAAKAFELMQDQFSAAVFPGWWEYSWTRLDEQTKTQYREFIRKLLEVQK